jgi:hypothetical protein
MTIRIELCPQPQDTPAEGARAEDYTLSAGEEVYFLKFAQAIRTLCEEAGFAQHVSYIRLSPEFSSGSYAKLQRSSNGSVGVRTIVELRFGKTTQEFERRYWGNPMNEPYVMVPVDDKYIDREAKYAFDKIVASALKHHQETAKPVLELSRILAAANAQS